MLSCLVPRFGQETSTGSTESPSSVNDSNSNKIMSATAKFALQCKYLKTKFILLYFI